ncbi:putative Rubrerythrin [Candidatus Vecturithrix granuli]|uniref:Putative Rubrerythrin n=1 Tax=Vecturithrix granuli TaxID=1499967 RepID=A0A081C829_VECG1|nr:putative Rubrerythrin [Candidatus Vecturithrix granuli]
METILKIFEYAMTMEKQGQQFYLKYKDTVEGERFQEIFASLARVEEEHYALLKKQYDLMKQEGTLGDFDAELSHGDEIFERVLRQEQAMKDPEADQSLNNLAIMRMAYLIEKDFADFYKKAVEQADSLEAKKLLSSLAAWEEKHRQMFYDDYQELMEANWGEQGFAPF